MPYVTSLQESAFDLWKPTELQPEIFSIFLVFIIITFFVIFYNVKIRKLDSKESPSGLTLLIFNLINYFKLLVSDMLGQKFVKWTPYFLTLFVYIWGSNLIGILGFENPTSTTTVTFSLGIITVVGTFVLGVRFQRSKYFLKYFFKFTHLNKKTGEKKLIPYFFNPLGVLDNVTPLLSISLRLWGNIFAGALILSLFYSISMALAGFNPLVNSGSPFMLIMGFISAPLHGFFDLLAGTIQAFVFTMLTLSYWGAETNSDANNEGFESNLNNDLDNKTNVSLVLNSIEKI
ncbi:MAG: F0F1 ATP synthase subunit A [Malacoplasma sp.]|nr:F0F1 ATP synthase subunit A [Malacoplasma sp.]